MLGTRDLNTSGDKTGMRGHGTQRQTGSFSTAAGTPRVRLKTTGQHPRQLRAAVHTGFWGRRVPASLLGASPMLSCGQGTLASVGLGLSTAPGRAQEGRAGTRSNRFGFPATPQKEEVLLNF